MPIIPGIQENKKGISYDSELFFPKALNMGLSGRSSDLSRSHEAFPSCFLLQKS